MDQTECGYSLFGICICDHYPEQMDKRCPYNSVDDCPVHNEELSQMQSHKCAYLKEDDQCVGDEHCQFKLTTACYPLGPHFCGKDQIIMREVYLAQNASSAPVKKEEHKDA